MEAFLEVAGWQLQLNFRGDGHFYSYAIRVEDMLSG